MTGIDTNVLVRFLTRDDEAQYLKAVAVFNAGDVLVTKTVWLETEWVLRFAYAFDARSIVRAFRDVLGLPGVRTDDKGSLLSALSWHEHGLDFADALHLAGSQDAATFMTFDRDFVSKSSGVGLCRVTEPS